MMMNMSTYEPKTKKADEFTKGVRALRNMAKGMLYRDLDDKFKNYTERFLDRMGFRLWMDGKHNSHCCKNSVNANKQEK